MAREPARYFAKSRELWGAIRWPDLDRLSRKKPLTAGDLRRALAEAPGHVGLLHEAVVQAHLRDARTELLHGRPVRREDTSAGSPGAGPTSR